MKPLKRLNTDRLEVIDEVLSQLPKGTLTRQEVEHIIEEYESLVFKYLQVTSHSRYKWLIPHVGYIYNLDSERYKGHDEKKRRNKKTVMLKTFNDVFVQLCKK